jgi:hypothetical protein
MATEFISNSWLMPTNANAEANRVSNYSLDFDSASSQYISINSSGALDTFHQNPFSISFWFKTSTGGTIILSEKATSSSATSRAFYIYLSGGVVIWYGATASPSYTNGSYNDGNWHHIACVAESDTVARIYIDGVDDTNKIAKDRIGTSSVTAPIILGTTFNQSGFFFNGSMTEFSIFDYALSASQVTELYGTGSAIGNPMAITNGRKPISYYPLGNSAFNGEFLASNGAEQDYVFDFDGSQYIDCGNDSSLDITGNGSISFWLNADVLTNFDGLVSKAPASGSITTDAQYNIEIYNNKIRAIITGTDLRDGTEDSGTSPTITIGTWEHFLITWDGTNLSIYKNGVFAASKTQVSNPSTNANSVLIGKREATYDYDGKMSNVAIFNTALPATGTESVASLYNYGTPPNIASYSNLQAWWELDASATFDGSNWSIPDASSNSNTGTSSGMTAANLVQSDLIINAPYDSFSLDFDGNDYITFGSNNFGDSSFSVSIWFNQDSGTGYQTLIGGSGYSGGNGFGIFTTGNKIQVWVAVSGSSTKILESASSSVVFGNWNNVVVKREYNVGWSLYLNNVEVDTETSSKLTDDLKSANSNFGKHYNSTSYFDGKLSNISIYNTNLSAAQVTTLYNSGKPFDLNTFAVTPVSWWRLGAVNSSFDSTNWTVLDEIGTNNGTHRLI